MMNRPYYQTVAALTLIVASALGCSQADDGLVKRVPVDGIVLVKGSPAAGARIVFYPKDSTLKGAGMPTPGAIVEDDGTFRLTSYEPGDGAPVGEYAVTVVWREEIPEGESLDTFQPKDRLQGRYSSPDRSGLEATVPEGGGSLPSIEIP